MNLTKTLSRSLRSLGCFARSSLRTPYVGVKGLAPVFIGLVFGAGFSGWPQAENSLQSGNGFGG
jgi:hypothetical protein